MSKMLAIAVFVVFVACSGGPKKPSPSTSTSPADGNGSATTGEGVGCEKEIALVCPDGQIDGCLKTPQEGTTHACIAK